MDKNTYESIRKVLEDNEDQGLTNKLLQVSKLSDEYIKSLEGRIKDDYVMILELRAQLAHKDETIWVLEEKLSELQKYE